MRPHELFYGYEKLLSAEGDDALTRTFKVRIDALKR